MVGLIDIAPAIETVNVQDMPVAVHGISAKGLAYLLGRFPESRKLMTGQEVQADQLMAMGRDARRRYPATDAAEGRRPFRREADGAREHPRHRRRSIRYGAGFEIAEAIDALLGANYPPDDVWAMTPRQIAALLYFARRRRQGGANRASEALAN